MGRGAPKGRRGAAVLRGGRAVGDGGACAVCATGRRICVRATGRGGVSRGGRARAAGRSRWFLRGGAACAGGRSRRFLRGERACARRSCGQGFGLDGPCGVPADSAALARGNNFRAAFLWTVAGPQRPLRGETASARSSRPAPLPPPASGQEMAGDRVVSVAGDLPCERMRPRAGVCQSLFLRDWVFLPSSIIILKVTASSNERRSSPMARCTFSSRYTSVLRWM